MLDLLLLSDITDPDAIAWRAMVRAAGGSVSPRRARDIERLIKALKAGQSWWLRDDYAAYAGAENAAQALVTLKRRVTQVANNNPTLGATGFAGNTSAYIDTKWNPASGAWQYTQNSGAYGCWVAADPGVDTTRRLMGNEDADASEIVFGTTGNITAGINTATPVQTSPSYRIGLIEAARASSAAQEVFQDTASLGTGTQTSTAIPNRNFYVLASNASGGAVLPINSTVAMAFIGGPLNATQRLAEWEAWKSFLVPYGVTGFDIDAVTWGAAVAANGGTVSTTQMGNVSTLIASLKGAGSWSLMDDSWLLVTENATQALTSLKQHRLATAVNSPTFTAGQGYAFDGVTNYLDTGFIASAHALVASNDNVRIAIYQRTDVSSVSVAAGGGFSSRAIFIRPRSSGAFLSGAADSSAATFALNTASGLGYFSIGRKGPNATDVVAYQRGVPLVLTSAPTSVNTLPTVSMFIGANNNNGTPNAFLPVVEGAVVVGAAGYTDAQELGEYSAIQAYMAAWGANV